MRITDEPIDLNVFLGRKPANACGASASFVGWVRDENEGKKVLRLFYECYRPMAEREIERILDDVKRETGATGIRALHRVGLLQIGDAAVAIVAEAPHRGEAFSACRMVIDQIKSRVPIWKKETFTDGSSEWVSCAHDHEAATR